MESVGLLWKQCVETATQRHTLGLESHSSALATAVVASRLAMVETLWTETIESQSANWKFEESPEPTPEEGLIGYDVPAVPSNPINNRIFVPYQDTSTSGDSARTSLYVRQLALQAAQWDIVHRRPVSYWQKSDVVIRLSTSIEAQCRRFEQRLERCMRRDSSISIHECLAWIERYQQECLRRSASVLVRCLHASFASESLSSGSVT
jgi:hypothetical protein